MYLFLYKEDTTFAIEIISKGFIAIQKKNEKHETESLTHDRSKYFVIRSNANGYGHGEKTLLLGSPHGLYCFPWIAYWFA